ncbi:unnamed protein product, partial [Polarella glacialis]
MAEAATASGPLAGVMLQPKDASSKFKQWLFTPGVLELMATALLFAVGILVCVVGEEMDFITALYLITQLVTTIGYGDIVPMSNGLRIFLSFYVLAALVILAHYLGSLIGQMQDRLAKLDDLELSRTGLRQVNCLQNQRLKPLVFSSVLLFLMILFGMVFYGALEPCSCSYGVTQVPFCDESSYDSCAATGGNTKDYAQAFYMSVITLTTIGLGDFVPETRAGRWVGIFWMLAGTGICASWVGALTAFIFEHQQAQKVKAAIPDSEALFRALDERKGGFLTKAEHHLYTLTMQGLLSAELLQYLEK